MLNKSILLGTAIAAGAIAAEACTSWVIHPSVSESGNMIVQKCRDSYRASLDADIRISPRGIKYMRIGAGKHYPLFGMNDRGLVVTMNDGDRSAQKHPEGDRYGIYAATSIKQLVSNCENAREAVDMMLHIGRDKLKYGSNASYFIADPKRAFLIDLAYGYAEVKEITGGIIIITNTWHLPGGEEISTKTFTGIRADRAREANVRASLQKAKVNGKYTLRGCFDTSRKLRVRGGSPMNLHVYCNGKSMSLGCVCFDIDKEFPAYLSYGYTTLGPQQQTIYLPIPMSLDQLPDKMRDGNWAKLAYDLKDAGGDNQPSMAEFAALEDKFIVEVKTVRAEARKLLKDGKKAEAAKLLNDCFARQFAEADALLTKTRDEVVAAAGERKKTDAEQADKK